jgi:hypothetical protein
MIRKFIRRLISLDTPLLGRWCHRDKSKNDWKIDMANIDHCGTCANDKVKPLEAELGKPSVKPTENLK